MKRQLEPLYRIACNEAFALDTRYAAARQMVDIRRCERPAKDMPVEIVRILMRRADRRGKQKRGAR